jgi:hypothetical protein
MKATVHEGQLVFVDTAKGLMQIRDRDDNLPVLDSFTGTGALNN